MKEHSDIVSIL